MSDEKKTFNVPLTEDQFILLSEMLGQRISDLDGAFIKSGHDILRVHRKEADILLGVLDSSYYDSGIFEVSY